MALLRSLDFRPAPSLGLGSATLAVTAPRLNAGIFGRVFVTVTAMRPRFARHAAGLGARAHLVKINEAVRGNKIASSSPGVDALRDCVVMDAAPHGPFRYSQRLSFNRDQAIGAPIILLFGACRPSAIVRAIWSIVVNSIQRHAGRRLSHVGIKGGEVGPSFANRDAARSVIPEERIAGVSASLPHSMPNRISASVRKTMPRAPRPHVRRSRTRSALGLAPTRNNRTGAKVPFSNRFVDATIAYNVNVAGLICGFPLYAEKAKNCSGRNVYFPRHNDFLSGNTCNAKEYIVKGTTLGL